VRNILESLATGDLTDLESFVNGDYNVSLDQNHDARNHFVSSSETITAKSPFLPDMDVFLVSAVLEIACPEVLSAV
jgi:hypothetical protein